MLEPSLDLRVDLGQSHARFGAGLFETIRVQHGLPWHLDWHLERLGSGCAFLGMDAPPPLESLVDFIQRQRVCDGLDYGALRLMAVDEKLFMWATKLNHGGRGEGQSAQRKELNHRGHGEGQRTQSLPLCSPSSSVLSVVTGISRETTRFSRNPLNRFKTLSYLENLRLQKEAERRGLFDVIAPNEVGLLSDGGRSTLFVIRNNRILTPPVEDGALPGIARRALLEAGQAEEASLRVEDLENCEGAFLANALRGVMVIEALEGGKALPRPAMMAEIRACLSAP